jgi:hypothetical protein
LQHIGKPLQTHSLFQPAKDILLLPTLVASSILNSQVRVWGWGRAHCAGDQDHLFLFLSPSLMRSLSNLHLSLTNSTGLKVRRMRDGGRSRRTSP